MPFFFPGRGEKIAKHLRLQQLKTYVLHRVQFKNSYISRVQEVGQTHLPGPLFEDGVVEAVRRSVPHKCLHRLRIGADERRPGPAQK